MSSIVKYISEKLISGKISESDAQKMLTESQFKELEKIVTTSKKWQKLHEFHTIEIAKEREAYEQASSDLLDSHAASHSHVLSHEPNNVLFLLSRLRDDVDKRVPEIARNEYEEKAIQHRKRDIARALIQRDYTTVGGQYAPLAKHFSKLLNYHLSILADGTSQPHQEQ